MVESTFHALGLDACGGEQAYETTGQLWVALVRVLCLIHIIGKTVEAVSPVNLLSSVTRLC